MTAAVRTDDIQQVARLAGHVVQKLLARARPDEARALERGFMRDVTVLGFRAGGIEHLGIAHRVKWSPPKFLPGKVLVLGDQEKDAPESATLEAFLSRGGLVVAEGEALGRVAGERRVVAPFLPKGPVRARGAVLDGLPSGIAPLFWIDEKTCTVVEGDVENVEVVLEDTAKLPLVVTATRGAGRYVHFASPVVPFRREVDADGTRVTAKELAVQAELAPEELLAESGVTYPEALVHATITMLYVSASHIARALIE